MRNAWNRRWNDDTYHPRFELDGPDPSVRQAVDDGWFTPDMPAVDIGCGAGHNAAWLAQSGFLTIGIDYSPSAVERARTTYDGRPGLTFEVVDVTRSGQYAWSFDALVDRGCLHGISKENRSAYVMNLEAWTRPGSRFLLLMRTKGLTQGETVTNALTILASCFDLADAQAVDLGGKYANEPVPAAAMRFVRVS